MKDSNLNKEAISSATRPEDMQQSRLWLDRRMSTPESLPFSFVYGGQKVCGIPQSWNPVVHKRRIDANLLETVIEGHDPATRLTLRVEITQYQDYPVVEWVVWLENQGSQASPMIQDLLALDAVFEGSAPVLDYSNGDFYSADGYTPFETPLLPGEVTQLAPTGGRPCDGAFPYFRVRFASCGLTLAAGWPGQWTAAFAAVEGGVHISAGQEKTHLRLLPGEKIRTPRMTILSWVGNTSRAVNLWRRWYLAHILPRPDGQAMKTALTCAATDAGEEFTNANEENQIRYMEKFKQAGIDFDVWWIDAGWYPCRDEHGERKWWRTGSWEPDPERFPQGFGEVSRTTRRHGADLLVWFEPERVFAGSRLDVEHPEWLLKTRPKPEGPDNPLRLLDLGDPICRQWLTDHICSIISNGGIKIYRQDFNFPPLDYWRDNDADDRQGMHENLHVQGYLQFWDDLLSRNPGLWIDSCSSGGRRNDLESMRRSVPLHYTDYGYGNHAVKLAFHHTLYAWIPYFKEFTLSWDVCLPGEDLRFDKQVDAFSFHCGMAPMMFATLDIHREDYDFDTAVKMIAIWRNAAETMLHGDYYPLTPFSISPDQWVVRQFDMPENQHGIIQGFRLAECPEESITVAPRGFSPSNVYVFENQETRQVIEISGAVLDQEGFRFTLPKRSAAIWFYRIQNGK
jgi:alpha-galactosidase